MSPWTCEQSKHACSISRVRGCDARAWTRLLIRPSTVLVLHLSRFTAHARCYQAGTEYANSDGRLSDIVSNAPQDFPLRSDGPTVKSGVYPFKLDPLNIAILAAIIAVNAAFVACCLHIAWTRLCSPTRGEPTASAAPAATDVPQPGVAGGGPGAEATGSEAHIGMTAVVQPNDEVAIAVRVFPEAEPARAPDRQEGTYGAAQPSSDSASSVHTPTAIFKNPVFAICETPACREGRCGPPVSIF